MNKNWKLILVAVLVIVAVLVFVKLAPAWASVTGLISFCVGFVAGWLFGSRRKSAGDAGA